MADGGAVAQLGGDPDWWRGAVIYQIYPRSYQDSNGDGIGDLNGITQRLDYVASLGVDAIWISPFFVSPMDDFGYDVADYVDIDPLFGTLDDFDRLLKEAHGRGLRIIIDLVLSHTSDRHPWFVESRSSRTNAKADWFVWADPKPDGTAPNNWLAIFGGPAWEWDGTRRQYYMHNFLTSQPDLNFHNEAVQDAVLDVARFWLDRGVDGFRLDTANKYFHNEALTDNPPISPGESVTGIGPENPLSMQAPIHNINRPETLHFHARLRALMDQYSATMAVGEIGARLAGGSEMADYTAPGRLHMAYGFDLLGKNGTASHIRAVVEGNARNGATWSSWPLSNHDVTRVVSRFGLGPEAGPMLFQLLATLGGTPTLYQGEELALPEADVPFEKLMDPYGKRFWPAYKGRDGCRTPIPWDSTAPHAGFTGAGSEPWLPVDDDHTHRAVDRQHDDPSSPLARARAFLAWRRTMPALLSGDTHFLDTPEPVLAFYRPPPNGGDDAVVCAFNLSHEPVVLDLRRTVRATNAPGVSGARIQDNTITLEGLGAFIGLTPLTEEKRHG